MQLSMAVMYSFSSASVSNIKDKVSINDCRIIGGMLFFIPLTSTIYTLIRDYTNERNKQKEWTTHAISRAPESFVSVEEQRRRRGGVFGNLIAKFKSKSGSESETQTNKNSVNRSVRHNKRNRKGKR